ncbi:MAG: F0F1 ATP synthase subunit epsilon [Campylobacter sp.]|nr:F0F1 ATP synthase subunit epsilon [Campylobacter sp.]
MNDKFILEIVTPKGMIFKGDVKEAQFPGAEGELGIHPNHACLITLLDTGLIELTDINGDKEMVAINWGYLKVSEEKVTVLADGAVYVGGKNDSEIAKSISKAKELVESMSSESTAYATTIARIDSLG